MKEEKEAGKPEVVEETRLEAVEEPGPEPVEGAQLETIEESPPEPAEGTQLEAVEEPPPEPAEEAESPKPEKEGEPDPEQDPEDSIEDGLELDKMEVKPAEETPEEPAEEEEAVIIEPPVAVQEEAERTGVLALLADYWIWMVALLLGLSVVSAALLFVSAPEEQREEVKLGRRVHVVNASLGGEHYVRFNLWGPFRDAKGQASLQRGMPKIKHDLILSGGRPEVGRSILENDLYFLERHILEIVSNATGIPVDQLDLKGLSVSRYSDEAEVEEEG